MFSYETCDQYVINILCRFHLGLRQLCWNTFRHNRGLVYFMEWNGKAQNNLLGMNYRMEHSVVHLILCLEYLAKSGASVAMSVNEISAQIPF